MDRSVFISFAQEDFAETQHYINALKHGFSELYNRGHSLSDEWPLIAGSLIAESSAIIVFWSKNSLHSHCQAFECQTAIAMGKRIFTCLMDDTQLPIRLVNLASFDTEELKIEPDEIINFILDDIPPQNPERIQQIKLQLPEFIAPEPAITARKAKSVYEKMGWLEAV